MLEGSYFPAVVDCGCVEVVRVRAGCRRTSKASSVPLLLRPDREEKEKIKIKKKRTDYNSTITSLHCTTKAHPSIPVVGEKEERTALTTTTTTTTTDRQ